MQIRRWHIYPSIDDLEGHIVDAVLRSAYQAIKTRGRFRVVLAGGTTPRRVYARLARSIADWGQWHIYFGDERCLPVGHAERNDQMAYDVWLNHVAIPRHQIYSIPGEQGPEAAATYYAEIVEPVELFDLTLLGLGEDGHTASLFPGIWDRNSEAHAVPVRGAPKPPPERVSLSAARLSQSRQVFFMASGESKRAPIVAWRRGDMLPASGIEPNGGVDIMLDTSAWPEGRI